MADIYSVRRGTWFAVLPRAALAYCTHQGMCWVATMGKIGWPCADPDQAMSGRA